MPIPPPTSNGRSTLRQNPFPSGPRTAMRSPREAFTRARVPGPTGSMRNPNSCVRAMQRLIGRGRRRPGGESMKNWPGFPVESGPRPSLRSVYGPTRSAAMTLSRARRNTFLEGEGLLAPRPRDCLDRGEGAGQRGDAGNPSGEGGLADEIAVRARTSARRCIDDEITAAAADEVDDGGAAPSFRDLADTANLESRLRKRVRGSCSGAQLEADVRQPSTEHDNGVLVRVAYGQEDTAADRQRTAGRPLSLRERGREIGGGRHHLARGAHLRTEHGVGAGEAREGEDRCLDADLRRSFLRGKRQFAQPDSRHEPACSIDKIEADRLAGEGHGSRRARIRLENEELPVGERKLDVEEAHNSER